MENNFKVRLPDIIHTITRKILELLKYNFDNHNETFYSWFMNNSDYDFVYIYEMSFKEYFLENFTVDTDRVLSYYSQNLVYAINTYYDMYRDLTGIEHFVRMMVTKQFEYMDTHQLFMEN